MKHNSNLDDLQKELSALKAEKARLQEEYRKMWDDMETRAKRIPVAFKLHLELDIDSGYANEVEERAVLKKYGRMENGITRDFLVPGDMTLHALHYAIMKAFGWQNTHLHSYVPYSKAEFRKMTDDKVKEWCRLVGVYFRFPSEEFEDHYWDDDYEEGESIKTWLRSKYKAPYSYGGVAEHYLPAQEEVETFKKAYPKFQSKAPDQSTWGVYFGSSCDELIEKSMIWTVLKTPADRTDWETWKTQKEFFLKRAEKEKKTALPKFKQMERELQNFVDSVVSNENAFFDENGMPAAGAEEVMRKYESLDREIETYCIEHDPEPIPVLSALRYRYDYGDGWEVKITCTDAWYDHSSYKRDESGALCSNRRGFIREKTVFADVNGKAAEGETLEKLLKVAEKGVPICLAWDGMSVMDDVGGIGGFCNFLETINGKDVERKRELREWAREQGWTGRMSKPENLL